MRMRTTPLTLTPLERRDAPAALVGNNKIVYQDVDGDDVTVALSRPLLTPANVDTVFKFNNAFATTTGQQLQKIDLTVLGAAVAGVGITTSAVRSVANSGDGFANVGYIKADNLRLGAVIIDGDLGQLDCGDSGTLNQAITSLTVHSWGRFGTTTQALGSDLHCDIYGHIGTIVVKTDMLVLLDASGIDGDKIGSITIGGSLIGGSTVESGSIVTNGNIGSIQIKGDLVGGVGKSSGMIETGNQGSAAKILIGGSVIGGQGDGSGNIDFAGTIGQVRIAGSVVGGGGVGSGEVLGELGIASATVGGSVVGGAGRNSGVVTTFAALLGSVRIAGDLRGGAGQASGRVSSDAGLGSVSLGGSQSGGDGIDSGTILALDTLGTVKIAGDLRGGVGDGSGRIDGTKDLASVQIRGSVRGGTGNPTAVISASQGHIGNVSVGGSLIGAQTKPVVIFAKGQIAPVGSVDLAIGRVTVNGRVEFANILAGFTAPNLVANADAQIGSIGVGGDWFGSSVAAGVKTTNNFFGDGDDVKASGASVKDDPNVQSKIGSLTIGGTAQGTVTAVGEVFGISAENVGVVKVGGITLPTSAAVKDDFVVGVSPDFRVREI